MSHAAGAQARSRRTRRPIAVGAVIVTAAVIGVCALRSASWEATSFGGVLLSGHGDAVTQADSAVTEADGALPDGVTVFDSEHPGVANLDPGLLHALRRAATDAADSGITIYVNSGWRSPTYQDQLFREAVSRYGSRDGAARWVATVDRSRHVSGDAVDIGHSGATAWLSEHGARYGLCQIYSNEPWHYELRPESTVRGRCPPMYADPAHDPRMRR